ncbi:hypothetical protein BH23CHL8_BH23CHL8_08400 [soil metagenome]
MTVVGTASRVAPSHEDYDPRVERLDRTRVAAFLLVAHSVPPRGQPRGGGPGGAARPAAADAGELDEGGAAKVVDEPEVTGRARGAGAEFLLAEIRMETGR